MIVLFAFCVGFCEHLCASRIAKEFPVDDTFLYHQPNKNSPVCLQFFSSQLNELMQIKFSKLYFKR